MTDETSTDAAGAPPRGLGDMVADGLAAVGVTKERVQAAVGRDCGCDKRRDSLNSLGARYLGLPRGRQGQNGKSPPS